MNCAAGVCTATGKKAVLNAGDLVNMLSTGDATVQTGGGANAIDIKASITWANASHLTLNSDKTITIKDPVVSEGGGGLSINTKPKTAPPLIFQKGGAITFWDVSSDFSINGNSYLLTSDLASLASAIAVNPSGFFALANDYDASADGTYTSPPISTALAGSFEGLGHSINNLSINSSVDAVGLFEEVDGDLRDVGIVNASITGSGSGGALAASANSISGCYASGSLSLSGDGPSGGLVGAVVNLSLSRSDVSVTSLSAQYAGGLAGTAFYVSKSYATGSVTGGEYVGGLTGLALTVDLSHESGNVTGAGYLGGLTGGAQSVSQSFATGSVTGTGRSQAGGLVGHLSPGNAVSDSYATGTVTIGSKGAVGGLLGAGEGGTPVSTSYSIGPVNGGQDTTRGAIVGTLDFGTAISDYWNTETTGGATSGYGRCLNGNDGCKHNIVGLTTSQFQSGLPTGFDPSVWTQSSGMNGGYPYLIDNRPQ